jgi:hypothetical protein
MRVPANVGGVVSETGQFRLSLAVSSLKRTYTTSARYEPVTGTPAFNEPTASISHSISWADACHAGSARKTTKARDREMSFMSASYWMWVRGMVC